MEKILITGANGFLGGKLIKLILDETDWEVYAVVSVIGDADKSVELEKVSISDRVSAITDFDFINMEKLPDDISGVVHLAFARRMNPPALIASSIDFSMAVFEKAAKSNASKIINMSSQGVYGTTSEWRTEKTTPAPNNLYPMAKYATEKVYDTIFSAYPERKRTSIRMDCVIQSQNLVKALCKDAKETGVLYLKGGTQYFSYIDADDCVAALLAILKYDGEWAPVYNDGLDHCRYSLIDIANVVCDVAKEHGISDVNMKLEKQNIEIWAGMDSTLFMKDTGWKPKYDLRNMVERIYESC